MIKHFKEKCWILYGFRFKKYIFAYQKFESEGTIASVDFDWIKVLNRRKFIIGFNHTHPGCLNHPSSIDDTCMIGWVKTLGKPLLCGIKGSEQCMYLYERTSNKIISHKKIDMKIFGNLIITKE